nr:anti-sigma factor [Enterovirga sp. DB1703]
MVDGRLTPERAATVEAYLAARPEEAARIQADRAIRAALRERLAPKAGEPVPARLRAAAVIAERRRIRRGRLRQALAACLVLLAGGTGGWFARDLSERFWGIPARPAPLPQEALAAHRIYTVEVVHPVEVKADQGAHLAQWLSKRLGRRLAIPDLEGVGFRLIGGRLLPAGRSDVAAQLMYGAQDGSRLTLYVRCGEAGRWDLRVTKQGEFASATWATGGYGYALSGALDPDRLMMVARAALSEMTGGG